jgi:dihydrofolate synthase/folylpolyglutamate synthase
MDLELLPKLTTYHLPKARYQVLSDHPKIILDGAHNEPALKNLKSFLDQEYPQGHDLVFGCLSDRDFSALAGIIVPKNGEKYWACFDGGQRTPSPESYAALQRNHGGEIVELNDAFKTKLFAATRPIIVCGSLYLCSQFYRFWTRPFAD